MDFFRLVLLVEVTYCSCFGASLCTTLTLTSPVVLLLPSPPVLLRRRTPRELAPEGLRASNGSPRGDGGHGHDGQRGGVRHRHPHVRSVQQKRRGRVLVRQPTAHDGYPEEGAFPLRTSVGARPAAATPSGCSLWRVARYAPGLCVSRIVLVEKEGPSRRCVPDEVVQPPCSVMVKCYPGWSVTLPLSIRVPPSLRKMPGDTKRSGASSQVTYKALLEAFADCKDAERAAWVLDEMLEMQVHAYGSPTRSLYPACVWRSTFWRC